MRGSRGSGGKIYRGMRDNSVGGGSTRPILVILLYIRIKEGQSGPDTEKQR